MTREEAIKLIGGMKSDLYDFYDYDDLTALEMAIKALEQEPKTGHWYDKWGKDGCSVCNEGIDDAQTFDGRPFRYCPMCGAKMKGGEE